MADEQREMVDDPETAWLRSLEELADDPAAQEAEDEADDAEVEALKLSRQTAKAVENFINDQKIEDLVAKFETSASDDAKALFAIYRTGDESEAQVKRIMQLAITKAGEARKGAEPSDAPSPEQQAARIAQDAYGVGPLSPGQSAGPTPEEVFDSLREQGRKGDMHASFALWNNLPSSGEVSTPD